MVCGLLYDMGAFYGVCCGMLCGLFIVCGLLYGILSFVRYAVCFIIFLLLCSM